MASILGAFRLPWEAFGWPLGKLGLILSTLGRHFGFFWGGRASRNARVNFYLFLNTFLGGRNSTPRGRSTWPDVTFCLFVCLFLASSGTILRGIARHRSYIL